MSEKKLSCTKGKPFIFGLVGFIIGALQYILTLRLISYAVPIVLSLSPFRSANTNPTFTLMIQATVMFLIFPGIYFLLLFLGKTQKKRGKVFGIGWLILSSIIFLYDMAIVSFILPHLSSSQYQSLDLPIEMQSIVSDLQFIIALSVLSAVFIAVSCSLFIVKIYQEFPSSKLPSTEQINIDSPIYVPVSQAADLQISSEPIPDGDSVFCRYCGCKNLKTAKFCSKCGKQIS